MREHFIEVVLIGCLVIGALAMAIYGRRTGQGRRAVQVFLLGGAGLAGVWLIRNPSEAEVVIERVVRGILGFATRLF